MSDEKNTQHIIDLAAVARTLKAKRKTLYKVWAVTFVLSSIWILPKPKYFQCEVVLAPESSLRSVSGNISSLVSSLGVKLGDNSRDAIYPMLYPNVFESPDFLVGLLSIQVETLEDDIHCDYYTYLKCHQKENWLTKPIGDAREALFSFFASEDSIKGGYDQGEQLNPFFLSKEDYMLLDVLKRKITCSYDKQTSVITIRVKDQDKLACALLADSIRVHLQQFITDYRTQKARQDAYYYKHLTDSAYLAYTNAAAEYSAFCDAHRKSLTQTVSEEQNRIKNELNSKLQIYNTFNAQYQAMTAKVQENTPAFTTLMSATVPQRAAGPKRKLFVIGMMILSTIIAGFWLTRKELFR